MARMPKTAKTVRDEAEALAREWSDDRERDGDPEGAGVLHDLADRIAKIPLTFNPEE